MSTTPVQDSRPALAPPASASLPQSAREEALSSRIRRSTLRRRLLMATDVLAVADLLLGMNDSLTAMKGDQK